LPGLDLPAWLSTVQDPATWAVIGIISVVPTTSILDEPLKSSVQGLIASARSIEPQRPIPVFHFPHRFTEWCAEAGKTTGYIDAPLNIRLSMSFTISAWVRRSGYDAWRCFLSVESPHVHFSLLWLGNFPDTQPLTVLFSHNLNQDDRVALKGQTNIPRDGCTWVHIAFVQKWEAQGKANECSLFINGRKDASCSITAPMIHIDGVSVAI